MRALPHQRRVLRMTLSRGLNMDEIALEGFSEVVRRSGAEYVEVKAYTAVGKSRARMGPDFVPSHEQIRNFARALAEKTGYELTVEHEPSRCVLLCRDKTAKANRMLKLRELCGEKRAFC